MNRRELFQAVAGVAAASGVTLKASTIDADAKPALALLETDHVLSQEVSNRIRQSLEQGLSLTALAGLQVLILSEGLRLTFLDAHGRPLNRRLEDEPAVP